MVRTVGDRVGAIQSADKETVYLYGYGEYIGDTVPTRGMLGELGRENPTIRLDNGQIVYGFECWWTGEEKVKSMIGGREVIVVPVEEG